MSLSTLIRGKNDFGGFATATVAILATAEEKNSKNSKNSSSKIEGTGELAKGVTPIVTEPGSGTVAKIARIAVANHEERESEPSASADNNPTLASWRWLLYFTNREPMTVSFSPPVIHAEVLAMYPGAVAAEPVPDAGRSAAPMTGDEERAIRGWLESTGEDDSRIIDETIERCRRDAGARNYFLGRAEAKDEPDGGLSRDEAESIAWNEDDRRRCVHCLNLLPGDACKVAEPGGLVAARRGYRPNQEWLQRCPGYRPCPDDPDRRTGAERWRRSFI
jgi:hypothetical protein